MPIIVVPALRPSPGPARKLHDAIACGALATHFDRAASRSVTGGKSPFDRVVFK